MAPATHPTRQYSEPQVTTASLLGSSCDSSLSTIGSTTPKLPIGMTIVTSIISVLPLVFLISVILVFYISLRRHRPQNTYGLAPMIVITKANRRNSRKYSEKTADTALCSDTDRYSTCDGLSGSAVYSDWSINTSANSADEQDLSKNANSRQGGS